MDVAIPGPRASARGRGALGPKIRPPTHRSPSPRSRPNPATPRSVESNSPPLTRTHHATDSLPENPRKNYLLFLLFSLVVFLVAEPYLQGSVLRYSLMIIIYTLVVLSGVYA